MSLYFDKGANRSLSNLDAEGEEKFTDKQDTLVSGENIKTINGVSVLGEGNIEVGEGGTITVNQTYDPTSSYAQSGTAVKEALDYMNGTISNCILEIPQTFNVTLENNVLTVKSGSTFVLTGSTYATRTLTVDKTVDLTSRSETKVYILMSANDSVVPWFNYENTGSVTTLPADSSQYLRVFNVTDKQYYLWSDADNAFTVWGQNLASYPLCVVEKVNGVWQFAKDSKGRDLIFNGCGYIGHHIFYYPNPRIGLRSNGFNGDGTLASDLVGTASLSIVELNTNGKNICYSQNENIYRYRGYYEVNTLSEAVPHNYSLYYVKDENIYYEYQSGSFGVWKSLNLIDCACDNNYVVTKFDIRQPYEGARDLPTDSLQADVTTLTGYDSTKTQTLKNVNGTLTWVDD